MRGISSSHFKKIRNLIGKRNTITLYAATNVNDAYSGDIASISYSAGTTISGVFLRRNAVVNKVEEGELEEGDAYLMVDPSTTVNHHDKVKVDSKYYIINSEPVVRHWGDNEVQKFCTLIFYGDA